MIRQKLSFTMVVHILLRHTEATHWFIKWPVARCQTTFKLMLIDQQWASCKYIQRKFSKPCDVLIQTTICNEAAILVKCTEAEWYIHASVSQSVTGSDNGLSPPWRKVIIWTNADWLLTEPLWTKFSEIWIKIQQFSYKKKWIWTYRL